MCFSDQLQRRMTRSRQIHVVYAIVRAVMMAYYVWHMMNTAVVETIQFKERKKYRGRLRLEMLNRLIRENDVSCQNELRMPRNVFNALCEMVRDIGGLRATKNMSIEEIVTMFLYALAHHKKNRSISQFFIRSGKSVSRHFNKCLSAVLKLHGHLVKKPTPISDQCEDDRWKCFKNCLGALDGTYISVTPPSGEKTKYRTRKGTIAMNVLAACNPEMEFTYVLTGWEGSAHDGRVLRNALSRPDGLRVPRGCYYLVDGGYANCEGFLAPYRGHRYHLIEWGSEQPNTAEEFFNMKHARARNVVERLFGLLKGRWAILRSPSFFPIKTQGRIVLACCLLHNLIRKLGVMNEDDYYIAEEIEEDNGSDSDSSSDSDSDGDGGEVRGRGGGRREFITNVDTSDQWTNFRNSLAQDLFNGWRARSSNV